MGISNLRWLLCISIILHVSDGNPRYVTYTPGSLPLILTVPHGGKLVPDDIKRRTIAPQSSVRRGCYIKSSRTCLYDHRYDLPNCSGDSNRKCKVSHLRDSYTKEIALGVADAIHKLTGRKPYMIINEVSREYVDTNRVLDEATFMDRKGIETYNTFNRYIEQARAAINRTNYGLLLDIHGQTHRADWTEIGCTVSKNSYIALQKSGTPIYPSSTTIRGLASRLCHHNNLYCFYEILKGRRSLGYFITSESDTNGTPYRAVPSPSFPSPEGGGYYSGGYITKTYGSKSATLYSYYSIDSLQVEMPSSVRRDRDERNNFIPALARAIVQFMRTNGYIY